MGRAKSLSSSLGCIPIGSAVFFGMTNKRAAGRLVLAARWTSHNNSALSPRHIIRFTQGRGPPCPVSLRTTRRMERREAPECLRGTLRRAFARGPSASRHESGLRSPSREARAPCNDGVAKPTAADAAPPGAPPASPHTRGWRRLSVPSRHERESTEWANRIIFQSTESQAAAGAFHNGNRSRTIPKIICGAVKPFAVPVLIPDGRQHRRPSHTTDAHQSLRPCH